MKTRLACLAAVSTALMMISSPSFAQAGNWTFSYNRAAFSTPYATVVWDCIYRKTSGKGQNLGTTAALRVETQFNATNDQVNQKCLSDYGQRRAGMKR